MKITMRPQFLLPLLFLIPSCLSLDYTPLEERPFWPSVEEKLDKIQVPKPASGRLSVGSSRVDITPSIGSPLAGYGARTSVGIHAPVFVRTLMISNGELKLVLISLEVLAVTNELSEAVNEAIRLKLPLNDNQIMLTATHTHSGPGGLGLLFWERLAAGPFNRDYFEWVVKRIAEGVIMANKALKPSTLSSVRLDAGDLVVNRIKSEGPSDSELQVLIFESIGESQTTYLVNFTAHPTVLRSHNRLVSGDFPGALSRALEEDEGSIALYTTGGGADQKARPPEGPNVYERTEAMGRLLAKRILESTKKKAPQDRVALSSAKIVLPLPPPQPKVGVKRRLPAWIGRLLLDDKTSLQFFKINALTLIGIPGDIASEISLDWKERAREQGKDITVISLANDYIGYIMPSFYYDKPVHESAMSFNGPYMGKYLDKIVNKIILQ